MTFKEKIDKYIQDNGISNLKQLSKLVDIPYTTMRYLYDSENADNSRLTTIRKLSKFMDCTMDYLSYKEVNDINGYLNFNNKEISDIIKIPVFNDMKTQSIINYVNISEDLIKDGKKFFGLKLNNNEVIIFEKNNNILKSNNKIALILINDNYYLKKIFIDDNKIFILSINNDEKPIFYNKSIKNIPLKLIGIAIEKRIKIDNNT